MVSNNKSKKGLVRRATNFVGRAGVSAGRIGLETVLTAGSIAVGAAKRWPKTIWKMGELLADVYETYDSTKETIYDRNKEINLKDKLYYQGLEAAMEQSPEFYASMVNKMEAKKEKEEAKKERQEDRDFTKEQARRQQMNQEIGLQFNIMSAVGNLAEEMPRKGFKGENGTDYAKNYFDKYMEHAKNMVKDIYQSYGYQAG